MDDAAIIAQFEAATWASEEDRAAWVQDLIGGGAWSCLGSDGLIRRVSPLDIYHRGDGEGS